MCHNHLKRYYNKLIYDFLTIIICRSSILAEVQNSGNNKLPSNKNVLVLGKLNGKTYKIYMSLKFIFSLFDIV